MADDGRCVRKEQAQLNDNDRMSHDRPAYYRIYVQGDVDAHWLRDYYDLRTEHVSRTDMPDVTVLTGELVDQAALVGVLCLVHDYGLPILTLECFPYHDESFAESDANWCDSP